MIVMALSMLSVVLAVAAAVQYQARRRLERDVRYITEKLNEMATEHSAQKLLHQTEVQELRDLLTGINRMQEERQRDGAEYARTQMAMRRMLSNISHDLRTPLTVISGYVELLMHRKDITPEEHAELLRKISAKVRQTNHDYIEITTNEVKKALVVLSDHLNVTNFKVAGEHVIRIYDMSVPQGEMLKVLALSEVPVESVVRKNQSLEDYFFDLLGGGDLRG